MNISLSDALVSFAQEQASQRGFTTISDYVRELIRKDQERQALRGLLLTGAGVAPNLAGHSEALRARLRRVKPGQG